MENEWEKPSYEGEEFSDDEDLSWGEESEDL